MKDRHIRLIEGPVQEEWMEHGSCRGSDVEVFFPGRGTAAAAPARRICAGCPVRDECLDYAIENHEQHGVWGGLIREERRAVARARRGAA